MENGSGGFFSDLVFEGGIYGIWVGNQQFTSRNITVRDVSSAAIYLNWDWVYLLPLFILLSLLLIIVRSGRSRASTFKMRQWAWTSTAELDQS